MCVYITSYTYFILYIRHSTYKKNTLFRFREIPDKSYMYIVFLEI